MIPLFTLGVALAGRALIRSIRRTDLRGKVVVITGGSRGLGLDLARQLARKGCRLAICARDGEELERARAELSAQGAEVFVYPCDVTRRPQVESFIRAVNEHFGQLDVLIANAATIQVGPLSAMEPKDFEDAMNAIFWGAFHPTMAVLPEMRRKKSGHIVHISSVGGKVPVPHLSPYVTAKFALTGFSSVAHAELKQDGVIVTTVAPGLMRTGSHLNAEFKGQVEKEFAWFATSALSPLLSISSERAAASIVDAIEQGKSQVILSLPARLLALAHGVAPGLVTDLAGLYNRFAMPADSGPPHPPVRGMDVRHTAPGASIIAAGDADAAQHHQFPGPFGGRQTRGSA